MGERLESVIDEVSEHLEEIAKCFRPGAKITVLVRHPGFPERDFSLSDDESAEVVAFVTRRFALSAAAPLSQEGKE